MFSEKTETGTTHQHNTAESIANTFEWLITAFILAFVFRAFVLEAFRIPTGSMAETLKGDHFRMRCTQCGFEYDRNFNAERYARRRNQTKAGKFRLNPSPRCSSCGYYEEPGTAIKKSNGDRILVLKCLYQFTEPKRWDVTVFKNPTDPYESYIKRMIALPGETLQIIDGDVYINARIARKPPKVQREMWMPIYNNDYRPVNPAKPKFNGKPWQQPFTNTKGSEWNLNGSPIFTLEGSAEQIHTIYYDSTRGNDFKASYAYGNPDYYENLPFCSDLMMKFYAKIGNRPGTIGIGLSKHRITYKASIDSAGNMTIEKITSDKTSTILAEKQIRPLPADKSILINFANVDRQLIFEAGKEKLIFDLGLNSDQATSNGRIQPDAFIFGSGSLSLSHIALYRDTYYLANSQTMNQSPILRAAEDSPFTLNDDEFFVMGDNSPDSFDSRLWDTPGIGNNGIEYRIGTVPRDYLIGKAFFVYWPSGFSSRLTKLPIIPNIGQQRFIYGGTN